MTFRTHFRSPLLLSLLTAALAAQTPATTIDIGTWNLEFLGAPGNVRHDVPPRDDTDFQKIGAYVRDLGVAVLAVQEINDEATLQKVASGAGTSWRFLLGTTGKWTDGKTAQAIGFLYDSSVVDLLGAEELLELPREKDGVPIFHRAPVTAWFRVKATGFDFRLVTVHLKAGQKPPDEQKRRLEAGELHEWLRRLRTTATEDQDYLVLGDFNSSYGSDPEKVLEEGDVVRYVEQPQPTPTIVHFAEPIDQLAPGPGFAELRRDSYQVRVPPKDADRSAWRKTYSDHYPVTVRVDAAVDADPAAQFSRGAPEQTLPVGLRPAPARATAAALATAGATTPREGPRDWPPAVGAAIQVRIMDGTHYIGRLHQPLPEGPNGWLVIEAEGSLRAVPWHQIAWINLQ
jgi:endonuclease/exonuclease/phosphatase family metal-dependent hydrolase